MVQSMSSRSKRGRSGRGAADVLPPVLDLRRTSGGDSPAGLEQAARGKGHAPVPIAATGPTDMQRPRGPGGRKAPAKVSETQRRVGAVISRLVEEGHLSPRDALMLMSDDQAPVRERIRAFDSMSRFLAQVGALEDRS